MTPEERLAALEELARLKGLTAAQAPAEEQVPVTQAKPAEKPMTNQEALQLHSPIGGIAGTVAGMVSSFVTDAMSGLRGAYNFSMTDGTPQERAEAANIKIEGMKEWGYKPRTRSADRDLLGEVAPTVDKVSQWLDDGFYALSGGNAGWASTLKTAAYAPLVIMGFKGLRPTAKIANNAAKEAELAKNLDELSSVGVAEQKGGWGKGSIPKPAVIPDATVRAAQNIAGDPRRGAQLQNTLKLLRDAEKTSKKTMDSAWDTFRNVHGAVEVDGKPFKGVADSIRTTLKEKAFDLENMPDTAKLLKDIENLSLSKTPTEFNHVTGQMNFPDKAMAAVRDIDILRRRASVKGKARAATPDEAGQAIIREQLENSLDNIFEQTATEVGKGYTSGAAAELKVRNMTEAWKSARGATADYYAKFRGPEMAHRQVVKLLRNAASPEDVWSYAVGANALTGKIGGVNIIQHIKKILGDTSPAITDLRQAAVRDILSPLLGEEYNFAGAIKNIDKALETKYSLLKELNISEEQLKAVRKAAVVSKEMIARNPSKFDARYITQQVGALTLGGPIAKGGAHMRLFNRLVGNRLREMESKMTLKDMLSKGPSVPIIESSPEALDYLMAVAAGNTPGIINRDKTDANE